MKFFLKTSVLLLLFFFLLVGLSSLLAGYNTSITFCISLLQQEHRAEKIASLLTAQKFLLVQLFIGVVCILLAGILFRFDTVWMYASRSVSFFRKALVGILSTLPSSYPILIIPIISAFFFAFYLPVSYDEAWTYLNFTRHPPFVALCYYPAPNNHILHSALTSIFNYIPGLPTLLTLRFSSIITVFFTWLVLFVFIRRYYSQTCAYVVVGISSMLFISVYYSYMSRGYGMICLFFVISLYAAFKIIFEGNQHKHWVCFALSNILGFYTIPSYLYAFVLLNLFILSNYPKGILRQLLYNTLTVLAAGLLYTPVILVNGVHSLVSNSYVKPISRTEVAQLLPAFITETIRTIFGIPYYYILIGMLIAIGAAFYTKRYFESRLWIISMLTPFLVLYLHSVIPFPRTFNYYGILLVFLIVISIRPLVGKVALRTVLTLVIGLQIVLGLYFYSTIEAYEDFNISYYNINKKIIGNHTYYLNSGLFDANLLFELETHGYTTARLHFQSPLQKVDADTVHGFDYVIIDKAWDQTQNRKPVFSNSLTNVYR